MNSGVENGDIQKCGKVFYYTENEKGEGGELL
jgi:hypothetical protein